MHGIFFQDAYQNNKKDITDIWRFNNNKYRNLPLSVAADVTLFDGQTYDESYYESSKAIILIDGDLCLLGEQMPLNMTLRSIEQIYFDAGFQGVIAAIASGSFNLAIYDKQANKMLFINDFIASIPIYYAKSNQGTVVSTNPVAVFNTGLIPKTIDMTGVSSYAHLGYGFGSRHITRELNKLPANCCLEYDLNSKSSKILKGANNLYETYPERATYKNEKYAGLLKQACRRVANSSGKTASFLSGGLDSRLATASWPADSPLEHFTYGAENSAEILFAQEVAKINSEPLNHLIPEGSDIAGMIENIYEFSGLACFPERYYFAKLMAERGFNSVNDGFLIDVFLGGDFYVNNTCFSPLGKIANFLGIFIDQSTKNHSTEAIAAAYFDCVNLLKNYDQLNQYLDPDFIESIKSAKTGIIDDLCTEIKRFSQHTDSVAYIFRNITATNRSVNYTLTQGVNARQFLKVNYPLGLDKELIYKCLELSPADAAFRSKQLTAMQENYPDYAKIPYSRSLIPVTYPAVAHKWASILNSKNIHIPGFNAQYKDKALQFSNWGRWFKESQELRDIAQQWLLSGNITNAKKTNDFFTSIEQGKITANGHIFHIAGLSKWMSAT